MIETALKDCMMAEVSTEKWEPWSANKCSEKDVPVYKSGLRNSRFKIYTYNMFIAMCQLTSLSYAQPNQNR